MKKFKDYKSIDEIKEEMISLDEKIVFSDDFDIFKKQIRIKGITIPNLLVDHPMEGCDGNFDGTPGELTIRRYKRIAAGGAGLIWFEATAVKHEGRAYARQLMINEKNLNAFAKMVKMIRNESKKKFGNNFSPVIIMQLTHSGRFSKPNGKPEPVIACKNPYLQKIYGNEEKARIIKDDELKGLEEDFEMAACLSKKAGFDGVDVKACHRYLISELLSSYTRKGEYGGGFKGRTRFLINCIDRINAIADDDFIVTTRYNIYDQIPYPYGWGVLKDDMEKPDFDEPVKLAEILYEKGVRILNTTMGSPYINPHVNRPYDNGKYIPDENPIKGIVRLNSGIRKIQESLPDMKVIGTGYSWLRQYSPYLAAGTLKTGGASLIGYGREWFAYPDFAYDILYNKGMKKEKCCLTCGKCTELMRAGYTAGCVIRDKEIYAALYRDMINKK